MFDFFKGTVTPKDWAAVAVFMSVTAILIVAFYFLYFQKQNQVMAAVQEDLTKVTAELKKAQDTEKNIEALRAEAAKMNTLVEMFENHLPEKREIPSLISNFERIGNQLGLRVQLDSLPTITDATKETIPYKVTATGEFHGIISFVNLLEKDTRYLKISDLKIGEQEEGVCEGTFTLSTFRFIQPSPAKPEAGGEEPKK